MGFLCYTDKNMANNFFIGAIIGVFFHMRRLSPPSSPRSQHQMPTQQPQPLITTITTNTGMTITTTTVTTTTIIGPPSLPKSYS